MHYYNTVVIYQYANKNCILMYIQQLNIVIRTLLISVLDIVTLAEYSYFGFTKIQNVIWDAISVYIVLLSFYATDRINSFPSLIDKYLGNVETSASPHCSLHCEDFYADNND